MQLTKGVEYGMPDSDLRWRLKMVAAQVDKTEGALASWVEASYDAWSALYDDESRTRDDGPSAQTFVRDDSDAPHYPLPVYFDGGLRGVALADSAERPPWPVVEAAFGAFLAAATARLLPEGFSVPAANSLAAARARAARSAGWTTSSTNPTLRARFASSSRPVRIRSIAVARPTSRGARWVPPPCCGGNPPPCVTGSCAPRSSARSPPRCSR